MPGIALGPQDGEEIVRTARNHRVLCELPEMEVVELRFGPEFEGVAAHTHDDHIDSFYVIEGEAEFVVDGQVLAGPAGTYVAAPIGVEHGFRNAGPGDLRLLNISTPNVGFIARMRQR